MMRMAFEDVVKCKLRRLGKTQADLADALNYSRSYVNSIMLGRRNPAVERKILLILEQWDEQRKAARR